MHTTQILVDRNVSRDVTVRVTEVKKRNTSFEQTHSPANNRERQVYIAPSVRTYRVI